YGIPQQFYGSYQVQSLLAGCSFGFIYTKDSVIVQEE
ncbi:hypothetical protein SS7213T_02763, partial [Staphylococcus simiae CCM 7213 = CCUG 51256]